MRKFFLGALMALTVACTSKDTPTGPVVPVTPPGGTDPATPPPPPPPPTRSVVIKVYIPTSMSEFALDTSTSMFVVEAGNFKDSVLVRGEGTLKFTATTPDTISFTLAGNAQYPKVVATIPKAFWDSQKDTVKIVRIARKWTVRSGVYAGMVVTTDLIRPFTRNQRDNQSFWPRAGNDALGYWYPQLGWDLTSFPVKIWIDSDSTLKSSGLATNQSDYDNLRVNVDSLSKILGWSPFVASADSGLQGSIRSLIWNGLDSGIPRDDPWNGYFGGTYFASKESRFNFAGVAIHEWFHILGYNHTCAWVGRMAYGCTSWPSAPVDDSYTDIAYIEQRFAVNNIRRKTGAQYHFGENLNGTLIELDRPIDRVVYR